MVAARLLFSPVPLEMCLWRWFLCQTLVPHGSIYSPFLEISLRILRQSTLPSAYLGFVSLLFVVGHDGRTGISSWHRKFSTCSTFWVHMCGDTFGCISKRLN